MLPLVEIPLDEAVEAWLPVEVRQIRDRYGSGVLVDRPELPWRCPAALITIRDPLNVGLSAEASLHEATGDANEVVLTVFLAAIVPRAVHKRVHLWGSDLSAKDGQVRLLHDGSWLPTITAGPVLGPGIDRLIAGAVTYRSWRNPLRVQSGPRYPQAS